MHGYINSEPEYSEAHVKELIKNGLRARIDSSQIGEIVFQNYDDLITSINLEYLFSEGYNLENPILLAVTELMFDEIITFSHKKKGKPYSDLNTSDAISGVVFKKINKTFPENAEESNELHWPENGGWRN